MRKNNNCVLSLYYFVTLIYFFFSYLSYFISERRFKEIKLHGKILVDKY